MPTKKSQTPSDETNNVQPEPAPEPIDDAVSGAEPEPDPLASAPQERGEAEPERREAPKDRNQAKRDEIFETWAKARDAEEAGEPQGVILEPDEDPGLEAETAEEPSEEAGEPEEVVDEDPYVELKVDGKTIPKRMSEVREMVVESGGDIDGLSDAQVKKLAQMDLAAKNRLEEANRILDKVKDLQARPAADQPAAERPADQPGDPDRSEAPDGSNAGQTTASREQLQRIAELIQIGEEDDAVEGVSAIIEMARANNPALSEERLAELVSRQIVQHQQNTTIDQAVADFRNENPDLFKSKFLANAGTMAIADEMLSDLRSIGANEEALAKIANDPEAVTSLYRQAMSRGHKVRSFKEVFDAGAAALRAEVGLSKPGTVPADPAPRTTRTQPKPADQVRADRKAAAPHQPRTAGAREQPKPSGQRPQSSAEVVAEMRAARGYRPIT